MTKLLAAIWQPGVISGKRKLSKTEPISRLQKLLKSFNKFLVMFLDDQKLIKIDLINYQESPKDTLKSNGSKSSLKLLLRSSQGTPKVLSRTVQSRKNRFLIPMAKYIPGKIYLPLLLKQTLGRSPLC